MAMTPSPPEVITLPCGCIPSNVLAECDKAREISAGLAAAWQRSDIKECHRILVAWLAHRRKGVQ